MPVISMMLWISWIFLASSPWYSHEAEGGSVEMREEARICLTARGCCPGQGLGREVTKMKLQELELPGGHLATGQGIATPGLVFLLRPTVYLVLYLTV